MSERKPAVIGHDQAVGRFTAELDGHRAELDYLLDDGVLRITHTGVPTAIGGRGVAGDLVRNALAFAHGHGYKVQPDCSYAQEWFLRHPEQQDLLS